jgi:hypothetical protein
VGGGGAGGGGMGGGGVEDEGAVGSLPSAASVVLRSLGLIRS